MNNVFPDTEMLGRFERRINYPAIIQHITDENKVVMDWSQAFKKIMVSKESVWEGYNNSTSFLNTNHATISDYFESGKKNITIEIHVLTDISNKVVVEQAMLLTTYTSMMDIEMEYLEDGPGDFYLYDKHVYGATGDSDAICVFRNVIVEISTNDDQTDVRPIVKHFVDLMSNALVEKKDVPRIKFATQYSAQEIQAGETFWVDITMPPTAKKRDYEITFQYDPLSDGLKYEKNEGSRYYIKTSKPGNYQFQIWIMDKRTLVTETADFAVTVKE
ncbi:MAG: hypothetical protein QNL62_12070 [Gammaproteobacteria bacterium]|nr:hypothetical protein [Gammaproteobacteria bacterium]